MRDNPADLLVVGDGPSGCAAALRAQEAGARVVVIGSEVRRGHGRLELLAPDVADHLASLRLPRDLDGEEISGTLTNWHGHWEMRSHFAHVQGKSMIVDRNRFDHALQTAVTDRGIVLLRSQAIKLCKDADVWKICLRSGAVVSGTSLLIATGRRPFAIARNNVLARSDRLVAVVARWELSARQEAGDVATEFPHVRGDAQFVLVTTTLGWGYSLSTGIGSLCSVFLSDSDLLRRAKSSAGNNLGALVPSELMPASFEASSLSSLSVHAASTHSRVNVAGYGWALAGDCRIAVDPLSGAGVARALSDGSRVALWLVSHPDEANRRHFRQQHVDEHFSILRRQRAAYARPELRPGVFWQRRQLPVAMV